jgi:drug/metabolite transporter (DMT)-like permease
MRRPLRSAVDLFRSRWWSIGWGVAAVAFALHVAALTLAPISIGQAVLAGGLVFLAVLAERFFGFELGRRQWIGIGLVAVSLALLTLTRGGGGRLEDDRPFVVGEPHADPLRVGVIRHHARTAATFPSATFDSAAVFLRPIVLRLRWPPEPVACR